MKSVQTSLIIFGLCWLSVASGIASVVRHNNAFESANRQQASDGLKAKPVLQADISFCEIFTPCVELSIPDSVVYALYDEEMDLFPDILFVIIMSFDSTNTVKSTSVAPVLPRRMACEDSAMAMVQRHIQKYLRDVVRKSKVRQDIHLSGTFEHTPIGDRFRERPMFGQMRYFFLQITTSVNMSHASFNGNLEYNCFRYLFER